MGQGPQCSQGDGDEWRQALCLRCRPVGRGRRQQGPGIQPLEGGGVAIPERHSGRFAGRVYVSDMLADSIYVLEKGTLSVFLQNKGLLHPNGLRVEGDKLLVAAWGADIQPDFTTKTPGHLLSVDLKTKAISNVGDGSPVGNLDGLEPDGTGNWIVTDWVNGALYRLRPDGKADQLMDLNQGSADLEYVEKDQLAIIPMMKDGKVTAYKLK